jgi:hypothetical protein
MSQNIIPSLRIYELWKIIRSLASKNFVFENNRRGNAYGHRYRIETPSHERCYLRMLQGKRSRFALPIEDLLYVTKTGKGGIDETPSRTRQSPFVDLLLDIIGYEPSIQDGATWIEKVIAIPAKKNTIEQTTNDPIRGTFAGKCPLCSSDLVWRKARLTGELYRGCTNYEGGCRYQERSYKRTPKVFDH